MLEQMTFYGCCNQADGMGELQSTLRKLPALKPGRRTRGSGRFQTTIFATSKLGLSVYLQIWILNTRNTNQDESTLIYDYNKTDPISARCLTVHQTRCISHSEKLQQQPSGLNYITFCFDYILNQQSSSLRDKHYIILNILLYAVPEELCIYMK